MTVPHAVETMFTTHKPAWAGIGPVFENKIYDPAEAIVAAGANWGVYKGPVAATVRNLDAIDPDLDLEANPEYEYETMPHPLDDVFGIFRDTDNQYLGHVGPRYEVVQNAAGFDWFKPFLEEKDAYIETAGVLRKGEIVWILARIEGVEGEVVPGDNIQQRLLMTLTHNSKKATKARFMNTRVLCSSTLAQDYHEAKKAKSFYSFRSTKSIHTRLLQVQSSLDLAKRSFTTDLNIYKQLANRQMTSAQFRLFLEDFYAEKLSATKKDSNGIEQPRYTVDTHKTTAFILHNFDNAVDLQLNGVRGTRWSAYNAIAKFINHQQTENRRQGDVSKLDTPPTRFGFAFAHSNLKVGGFSLNEIAKTIALKISAFQAQ